MLDFVTESQNFPLLLAVCFYYVTYLFYSESALCNCLNAKELLAPNREDIGSLSDCSRIGTHYHLARKQTLNRLAKMAIDWAVLWVFIFMVSLTVCFYHATNAF